MGRSGWLEKLRVKNESKSQWIWKDNSWTEGSS